MAVEPLALLARFQDRLLVIVGGIALYWVWHAAFLEWGVRHDVATWMHDRIMWFAGVGLLLAVLGLTRAALATAFAYPIVTVVGEVLGNAAWDLQGMFVEDWEPVHAGQWIAVGLFAWVALGAAWGEWRARRWARIEAEERQDVTQP